MGGAKREKRMLMEETNKKNQENCWARGSQIRINHNRLFWWGLRIVKGCKRRQAGLLLVGLFSNISWLLCKSVAHSEIVAVQSCKKYKVLVYGLNKQFHGCVCPCWSQRLRVVMLLLKVWLIIYLKCAY